MHNLIDSRICLFQEGVSGIFKEEERNLAPYFPVFTVQNQAPGSIKKYASKLHVDAMPPFLCLWIEYDQCNRLNRIFKNNIGYLLVDTKPFIF